MLVEQYPVLLLCHKCISEYTESIIKNDKEVYIQTKGRTIRV